jgi:putative transposase
MKDSFASVGIGRLCKLFGKTRHAFYDKNWYLNKRHSDEDIILELLYQIRREINVLSTKVIYHMIKSTLRSHGITIGRDELHEIRRRHGLLHKRRKKYFKTTDSNHRFRKFPNRIKDLIIDRIEQVWVSDITYIRINDGFSFLSLVTDAYSRKIVGYCLRETLEAVGPLIGLRMAISNLSKAPENLIHHSDRGIQYCCDEFVEELNLYCIDSSMTENGDPRENAIAERLNGILKKHFGLKKTFANYTDAKMAVERAVRGYNDIRPHQSVSMLTPSKAHEHEGILIKKWKRKTFKLKSTNENER